MANIDGSGGQRWNSKDEADGPKWNADSEKKF